MRSIAPEACVMIGDRIDNDVVPARTLGMHTIRFRTGRHAVEDVQALAGALARVLLSA
jgi:FMN phosphatase YigB (HAD superfamily)